MNTNRLEAFSDGVIAIIITIMVLEVHVPHETGIQALEPLLPVFLSYALSFAYVGIYWNNHHHLLHAATSIDARTMWTNHYLLFSLSLVPFVTAWVGENHGAPWPTACYGIALLNCGAAFNWLTDAIVAHHGAKSEIAKAIGTNFKGRVSLAVYAIAIAAALLAPWLSDLLYLAVAILWFVPDRRVEHVSGKSLE